MTFVSPLFMTLAGDALAESAARQCFDIMKTYGMEASARDKNGPRTQFTTKRREGGSVRFDVMDADNKMKGYVVLADDRRSLTFRTLDNKTLATVFVGCERELPAFDNPICEGAPVLASDKGCLVERIQQ
jgi:hypothetical protein